MNESTSTSQESIGNQLIKDISKIQQIALGEGVVVCQVCGSELPAGSSVSVFVWRPAGDPTFELGHVICGDDGHDLPTYFTLGVRELIVDGRIGRCVDVASNASWPILLEPSVRVVSTMSSKAGRIAPDSSTDSSGEDSWVYGDALLERASDLEPNGVSGDGSPPTDHDGTVVEDDTSDKLTPSGAVEAVGVDGDCDGVVHPANTDCPPGSRDDTVSADADSFPTAGTGPAGSTDATPADADGFSTAGTGPAGSDDVVLADADGSGDDSPDDSPDGTDSDVGGGE